MEKILYWPGLSLFDQHLPNELLGFFGCLFGFFQIASQGALAYGVCQFPGQTPVKTRWTGQITPQKDHDEEITGGFVGKSFRRMPAEGMPTDQTLPPGLPKTHPRDRGTHTGGQPSQKTPMDMVPAGLGSTDGTNIRWVCSVDVRPFVTVETIGGEIHLFLQKAPPRHPPLFSHPFPGTQTGNWGS